MQDAPRISVVVYLRDVPDSARATLASLERQSASVEVIVADGSDGAADALLADLPRVRRVALPGATMPRLKEAAFRAARAEIVGIVDPVVEVAPDFAREALAAFEDPSVAAVGGAVDVDPAASAAHRAALLFEYAAFVPPLVPGPTAGDLPGTCVAYRRAAVVEGCANVLTQLGFNKPFVHEEIRRRGGRLVLRPAMRVRHVASRPPRAFAAKRFHFGRCFGATRRRCGGLGFGVLYVIGAPAIPFVLGARVASRVLARPERRRLLRGAALRLAAICAAWGVGEWLGCWFGPGRSCEELY